MDSSQFSLEGKVGLISGGRRGIGRATAVALARAGADVVVTDIELADLEKVAAEIGNLGRRSWAMMMDVADGNQVRAAVRQVEEEWGKIDIFVSNAGVRLAQRFTEGNEDEWARTIAINLTSHIISCRAVLDGMIERGYGKIITIASDAGRLGSTGQAVYGAAKGGLVSFTRNLAMEMARHGINVNCVSPGLIDTAMWNAVREDRPRLAEAYERAIPWKRLGKPEEVAAVVLFLATDEARYITGQTISVNGGMFTA